MPSVTGRRLLLLAIAVGVAVVLAAALGHSESESRGAATPELDRSTRQAQTMCDALEAIAQTPVVLEPSVTSVAESTLDRYRLVVPYDGPLPDFTLAEPAGPTAWTRILQALSGLRDTLGRDRDEPSRLVTIDVPDCNQ